MGLWSEETNSPFEDVSFYLAWLNRAWKEMCASFLPFVFLLFFHGRFLILYSFLWTILVLHLLVIHTHTWMHVPSTTPFNVLLWVMVTQIALFKGHVHINGVRMLVVGIWYGGDNFLLDCSSTMLPWLAHCVSPFLFGTPGKAVFKGMPLFFFMISVGWEQDCPQRCLLAI